MQKPSFRKRVIDMEVGESITIAMDKLGETTLRAYACDLGFRLNRKYSTHRNREARTYTIIRTA